MMSVAASDESSRPFSVEVEQIVADHAMPGCSFGSGRWLVMTSRTGKPPGKAFTMGNQRWILPSHEMRVRVPKDGGSDFSAASNSSWSDNSAKGQRIGPG